MAVAGLMAFALLGLLTGLANAYVVALRKERDRQAHLAVVQERARVSREMHDILGHTLAVIVGLADGAAALAATQPERGAQTLRIIGDSGRQALAELRRLLSVISEDDGRPRPQAHRHLRRPLPRQQPATAAPARRPHSARTRGPHRHRHRLDQLGDRRAPSPRRIHRQVPHQPHPPQDRRPRPRSGGDLRLRHRPRPTGVTERRPVELVHDRAAHPLHRAARGSCRWARAVRSSCRRHSDLIASSFENDYRLTCARGGMNMTHGGFFCVPTDAC